MVVGMVAGWHTWLHNWDTDAASLTKVVSVPFQGTKLFGEGLEPLLVETKGKRKILPTKDRGQRPQHHSFHSSRPYSPSYQQGSSFSQGNSCKSQRPMWQPKKSAYKSHPNNNNNSSHHFPPKGGKHQ